MPMPPLPVRRRHGHHRDSPPPPHPPPTTRARNGGEGVRSAPRPHAGAGGQWSAWGSMIIVGGGGESGSLAVGSKGEEAGRDGWEVCGKELTEAVWEFC